MYDVRLSPLAGWQGELTGHLCLLRDVTELEVAREQAQAAVQAKSEFVSNVSHELRTPLTSAKLYLHLLRSGKQEKQEAYLDSTCQEIERLQALIESVLTISRLDLGKITPQIQTVNIGHLLQTLYQDRRLLFEDHELRFFLGIAQDLSSVSADPQLIEQVITNLLTNAMNYTPRGGIITLKSAQLAEEQASWITIFVTDTGLGIPDEEQQHIFERFRRGVASQVTGTPGTGLGLAICQEIMALHHGHITLQSQSGQGGTFTIWLPLG